MSHLREIRRKRIPQKTPEPLLARASQIACPNLLKEVIITQLFGLVVVNFGRWPENKPATREGQPRRGQRTQKKSPKHPKDTDNGKMPRRQPHKKVKNSLC